jgi:cation diffusion facilitator family transporter
MMLSRSFLWRISCHDARSLGIKLFSSTIDTNLKASQSRRQEEKDQYNKKAKLLQRRAELVTKAGGVVNITLAACKGYVGLSIGSTALIGDAANSLGDIISDAVVYYTLVQSRKKASAERPWGHGKMESLGSLFVGSLLLLTGLGVGYSSAMAAYSMTFGIESAEAIINAVETSAAVSIDLKYMEFFRSSFLADYGQHAGIGVSMLSISLKEVLFFHTLKAGKELCSSTIIANAWQHRADSFVSAAVLLGVAGSMFGFPLLDPLAGLLVSGVIIKQGIETGIESIKDLSDAQADAEETGELTKTCLSVHGVVKVNEIYARKSGPYLYVECTLGVPGYISASSAHRVAELVKIALVDKHIGRVANAVVHVEPLGTTGLGEKAPNWARDDGLVRVELEKLISQIPTITSLTETQGI